MVERVRLPAHGGDRQGLAGSVGARENMTEKAWSEQQVAQLLDSMIQETLPTCPLCDYKVRVLRSGDSIYFLCSRCEIDRRVAYP